MVDSGRDTSYSPAPYLMVLIGATIALSEIRV